MLLKQLITLNEAYAQSRETFQAEDVWQGHEDVELRQCLCESSRNAQRYEGRNARAGKQEMATIDHAVMLPGWGLITGPFMGQRLKTGRESVN